MAELIKRGSILCQRCGRSRHERVCPVCGWDTCFIRISFKGKVARFYKDRNKTTYSYTTAVEDLITINRQIKDDIFTLKNWLPEELEKKRFYSLWAEFIAQREKRLSPESLRTYKSYYKNHFSRFAQFEARKLQLRDFQLFLDSVNCSQKYSKCLIACLEAFYTWLERWDGTKKPLFPDVHLDKGSKRRSLVYEDQVSAIERIPADHRDIFRFMRETGLRVSEGCALKVKDLDFANNRVLIQRTYSGSILREQTKGHNALWIPLSKTALEIAEKHAQNRFGEDFLFINIESGNGYRAASLRRYWNVYSGSGVCVHEGIRHSTISDWSRHANAFQVRELARHSDIKVSQEYVHNALTDLRDIVDRDNIVTLRQLSDKGK